MAKLHPYPYPMPSIYDGWEAHEKAYRVLSDHAATLADDEYVGALIQWQVADGYAVYLVTSMKGRGELQHVPFADGYTVPAETIRGLRQQDIKDKVNARRAHARLFGRR